MALALEYELRGVANELLERQDPMILIEGPAGTGKTLAVCLKAAMLCEAVPGLRAIFVRKTRKSLTESVLVTLEEKVLGPKHPAIHGTAKRANRHSYLFPNGSEIILGGLDTPENTFSMEYDLVCIFEAVQVSADSFEKLYRLCRYYGGAMEWQQLIADTNPGNQHHYLNKWPNETVVRNGKSVPKMVRLLSVHQDNPMFWDADLGQWTAKGRDYIEGFLGALTGHNRSRLLEGVWCTAEGLVYDEYDPAMHPFEGELRWIGEEQKRKPGYGEWYIVRPEPYDKIRVKWFVGGQDWGNDHPGCFQLWAYCDPCRLIKVDEIYQRNRSTEWWAEKVAEVVKEIGRDWLHVIVCDHEMDRIRVFNLRIAGHEQAGLARPAIKGSGSVETGIAEVKEWLKPDKDGVPRLRFLERPLRCGVDPTLEAMHLPTCTLEEITAYTWDVNTQGVHKDQPVKRNDNGMDAMRMVVRWVFRRDLSPQTPEETIRPGTYGALFAEMERQEREGRRYGA